MSNTFGYHYQPLPMRAQPPISNRETFVFEKDGDVWMSVPANEPIDPAKTVWSVTLYQNKYLSTAVMMWRDGKSRYMSTHNLPQQVRAQLMLIGHNVK